MGKIKAGLLWDCKLHGYCAVLMISNFMTNIQVLRPIGVKRWIAAKKGLFDHFINKLIR